jgi:hypothetical protein
VNERGLNTSSWGKQQSEMESLYGEVGEGGIASDIVAIDLLGNAGH